jgi:beta-xylosidase
MGRARSGPTAFKAVLLIGLAALLGASQATAAAGAGLAARISGAGTAGLRSRPVIGRPRLGLVQTVDQNDVGDPFILPVAVGIKPPADVPYTTSGRDAYVSAPWTDATAATALQHGWYVLFGTTDWQSNVPTAISTDLVHWTQAPDALPVLPTWAAPSISMTWAPAALRTGDRWILYYSTEDAATHLECIGRAVATSPAGPYYDGSSGPLLCQAALGGSIDPSVIAGAYGAEFLVWKNDGNAIGRQDSIWSQQLSRDGLRLTGAAHRLLSAGQPWESGIIEAPAMVRSARGAYWLFYSGGSWNSNTYGTGLSYCASMSGPCTKASDGPFLATTPSVISPGGLDTFTDLQGNLWAAFTALVPVPSRWHPGRHYYNRVLDLAPVRS